MSDHRNLTEAGLPHGAVAAEPGVCDGCGQPSNVLMSCPVCGQSLDEMCLAKHVVKHGHSSELDRASGYLNLNQAPPWLGWVFALSPDVIVTTVRYKVALPPQMNVLGVPQILQQVRGAGEVIYRTALAILPFTEQLQDAIGGMEILAGEVYVATNADVELPFFDRSEVQEPWQLLHNKT